MGRTRNEQSRRLRSKKIVSAKIFDVATNAPTALAFTDNRSIDAMIYHFLAANCRALCRCNPLPARRSQFCHGRFGAQSPASFPRSRGAGIVLLAIDLVWSFWLVSTMEMGEFSAFAGHPVRSADRIFSDVALTSMNFSPSAPWHSGALCEPLLDAAFFRYESSRLVLTVLGPTSWWCWV